MRSKREMKRFIASCITAFIILLSFSAAAYAWTVSGTITDASGTPVPDVIVTAYDGNNSFAATVPTGITNSNGYFSFTPNIASGPFCLGASRSDWTVQANTSTGLTSRWCNNPINGAPLTAGTTYSNLYFQASCNSNCCTYSVNPTTSTPHIPASGGTRYYFDVTASGFSCNWVVTSSPNWVRNFSSTTGSSSTRVYYDVDANPSQTSSRSGNIIINNDGGIMHTVIQDKNCSYAFYPDAGYIGSAGGDSQFDVNADPGCSWTADITGQSNIQITSGGSGNGSGTVHYHVGPYDLQGMSTNEMYTITVGNGTTSSPFNITQPPGQQCSFTMSPPSPQDFGPDGGPGSIVLTASDPSCAWSITGVPYWITNLSPSSGSGSNTVNFTVVPNTAMGTDTATLTVSGQPYTITRQGRPCTLTMGSTSPQPGVSDPNGWSGCFDVAMSVDGCATWTTYTNQSWIHITSGTSGSSSGTVCYTVDSNIPVDGISLPRSGTVVVTSPVGNGTFSISQPGFSSADVSFSSNPVEYTEVMAGGTLNKSATITDNSASGIAISSVTLIPSGSPFSVVSYPSSLAQGSSGTVVVRFSPPTGTSTLSYSAEARFNWQTGTGSPAQYTTLALSGTVCRVPGVPTLTLPSACSGTEFIVSWSNTGATWYDVAEATDDGFTNVTFSSTTSNTSMGFTHDSGTYWYTVRARTACGTSHGAMPKSLTVNAPPASTTLTGPAGPVPSGQGFTLNWSNMPNVNGFEVYESPDGLFTNCSGYSVGGTSWNTSRTGPATYYYMVKGFNGCGYSGPSNVVQVNISAPAPDVSISPASSDLGATLVNDSSLPTTFTFTNNSPDIVSLYGISITGADSGDFLVSEDNYSNGGWCLPGHTVTFKVVFKPSSAGAKQATVNIPYNSYTLHVQVSGTGTDIVTLDNGDWCVKVNYKGQTINVRFKLKPIGPVAFPKLEDIDRAEIDGGVLSEMEDKLLAVKAAYAEMYLMKKYGLMEPASNLSNVGIPLGFNVLDFYVSTAMMKGADVDPDNLTKVNEFIMDSVLTEDFISRFQYDGDLRGSGEAAKDALLGTANALGADPDRTNRLFVMVDNDKFLQAVKNLDTAMKASKEGAQALSFIIRYELNNYTINSRLDLLSRVFDHNGMTDHKQAMDTLVDNFLVLGLLSQAVNFSVNETLSKVDVSTGTDDVPFVLARALLTAPKDFFDAAGGFEIGISTGLAFVKVYNAGLTLGYKDNILKAISNYKREYFSRWVSTPPTVQEISDIGELVRMSSYIELEGNQAGADLFDNTVIQSLMLLMDVLTPQNATGLRAAIDQVNQNLENAQDNTNLVVNKDFGLPEDEFNRVAQTAAVLCIDGINPGNGAYGIVTKPVISVDFSKNINFETISDKVTLVSLPFTLEVPTYKCGWGNKVTCVPVNPLSEGITYRLIVYSGIKDIYGNTTDVLGGHSDFTTVNYSSSLTAGLDVDKSSGAAPLDVTFMPASRNGGGSQTLNLDFGDSTGSHSTYGATVNHTYQYPGTYTAKVTLVDDLTGHSATATRAITVKTNINDPSSTITSPATAAVISGATFTITGSASDVSGSGLQKVEASTDGGTSWHLAAGGTIWSYTWNLPTNGSYTIKSRATDNAGNVETPGPGVNVTVANITPIVVLSLVPSPSTFVVAGGNATWTATATGGTGSYQYSYWHMGPDTGGVYVKAQDWGSSNTWTWATSTDNIGNNYVMVKVRNSDLSGSAVYKISGVYKVNPTLGISGLTANKTSPATVGSSVTWTATATGGTGSYLYSFWRTGPDTSGAYVKIRDWTSASTWNWTPVAAEVGNNYVMVKVKNSDSTGTALYKISGVYKVQAAVTPIVISAVTITPGSPVSAGTQVTVGANVSGGSGTYQYAFYRYGPDTAGKYVEVQPWGASASCNFTTSAANIGNNYFMVKVRNSNGTGAISKISTMFKVN